MATIPPPTSEQKLREALPDAFEKLGPELFKSVIEVSNAARANDSPTIVQGRLTLTSGTAVTTSDVTSSTVYFTPHGGNKIALYSGTIWQLLSFSELSVAVPSNTSTPFDIFAYNNSGVVALETTAWTDDTTRATALTTQDGIYVKTGALTRRYLGTGRTNSVSGQTEDSLGKRFLWNYYNRMPRVLNVIESATSWTYGSASWRAGNNSNSNRVQIVVGVAESQLRLNLTSLADAVQNRVAAIAIGEDSAISPHSRSMGRYVIGNGNALYIDMIGESELITFPAVGYHYYQWLELTSGLITFYGGSSPLYVTGLSGEIDG